jgi:3-hydroxyisobutyrate dehydrogenase-like beta-hydroxyacid dehydrogenase
MGSDSTASRGKFGVGMIGVGLMGTVMSRRLIAAGFAVTGFDPRPEARAGLAGIGGASVESLADLARRCDRAVISVFDTAQVEDVIEGAKGVLSVPQAERSLRVVINTATCEPDRIAALAERASARGLQFVELPISGTSQQVAQGDGVGLVAGDREVAEASADIIAAICPRTYFMGAFGNGAKTKLAINLVLGLNRAALAEGLTFAGRLGLPLDAFIEAAKGSAAYSQIMDVKGPKMIAQDFTPHGKVGQSLKDFGLILDAAATRGQALPLASVYADLMRGCVEAGEAELDNCAIIREIGRRKLKGPE